MPDFWISNFPGHNVAHIIPDVLSYLWLRANSPDVNFIFIYSSTCKNVTNVVLHRMKIHLSQNNYFFKKKRKLNF